jgi:hypothetical protein
MSEAQFQLDPLSLPAECVDGKCVILPIGRDEPTTMDLLSIAYERLKSEGLLPIVFHDRPDISPRDFVLFMLSPSTLVQLLLDISGTPKPAGIVWLADLEECNGGLTRGLASFCFYRDYQSPEWSGPFGRLVLTYWLDCLRVSSLVGLTPEPNRAAVLYAKRTGFKEVGRLRNHMIYEGRVCDAVVTQITQEDWKK